MSMVIFEPHRFANHVISSRLYCNPKALWKLNWFLRDFGYDTELLGRDEVDESQLVGLQGVVKISHIVFNGASLLRFDGCAPASQWEELSPGNLDSPQVAHSARRERASSWRPDQNQTQVEAAGESSSAPQEISGTGIMREKF
jgi:hypothetical protein